MYNKWNLLAGFLVGGGLVMLLFGAIASLMETSLTMTSMDIISMTESGAKDWADTITIPFLQNAVMTFIDIPVFLLAISLGVLLFVVNGIFQKK